MGSSNQDKLAHPMPSVRKATAALNVQILRQVKKAVQIIQLIEQRGQDLSLRGQRQRQNGVGDGIFDAPYSIVLTLRGFLVETGRSSDTSGLV